MNIFGKSRALILLFLGFVLNSYSVDLFKIDKSFLRKIRGFAQICKYELKKERFEGLRDGKNRYYALSQRYEAEKEELNRELKENKCFLIISGIGRYWIVSYEDKNDILKKAKEIGLRFIRVFNASRILIVSSSFDLDSIYNMQENAQEAVVRGNEIVAISGGDSSEQDSKNDDDSVIRLTLVDFFKGMFDYLFGGWLKNYR